MAFENIEQPKIINVNKELRLIALEKDEWQVALPWYENPQVLYYSEGVENGIYDIDTINRMYSYLASIGELYFIQALEEGKWKTIGDVTLSEENMPIVIGDEKYWGKSIGKKVIGKLIERAKEVQLKRILIPEIYKYNERSRNLFKFFGFEKVAEDNKGESYELKL